MKKEIDPDIKAYLTRNAFYVLLPLLAVCIVPFLLAQQTGTSKRIVTKVRSASRRLMRARDALPANIILVTNTNDSGPGSLRDALAAANDGDTIDATGVSGTILLTSGELQINHNVTINGPGAQHLAVNGNATFRVFENFASDVTISGFTVTNGLPPTGDNNGGGGILSHGGLTLIGTSILNNNAGGLYPPPDAGGGGIGVSAGGTLTVTASIISGNESQHGPGGGISAGGTVTVSNSTINNNEGLCAGGGIAFNDIGGTLTVMSSTIIGNSVVGCPVSARAGWVLTGGGGIVSSGSVTVNNSTISGNTVAQGGVPATGGGIACSGSMTVINSTISGNTVDGYMCAGGGIRNAGTFTLTNSTLSGNSAPSGQGGAMSNAGQTMIGDTVLNAGASGGTIFNNGGTITSLGYNIASDNGGGVLTGPGIRLTPIQRSVRCKITVAQPSRTHYYPAARLLTPATRVSLRRLSTISEALIMFVFTTVKSTSVRLRCSQAPFRLQDLHLLLALAPLRHRVRDTHSINSGGNIALESAESRVLLLVVNRNRATTL